MEFINPEGWERPRGYSNGVAAEGRQIFIAGQIGWTPDHQVWEGFGAQVRQAFQNTVDVLAAAGARPEHLVRMTWFITDREAYSAAGREIGEAYKATIGKHFPAMTVVEVSRLLHDDALVEIESAAVVPKD